MKKIITTILLLILGLPTFAKPNYSYSTEPIQIQNNYQGIYVNEEVDVPITQIGIPQELLQTQIEEKGLEISWNSWRANVFNVLADKVNTYNIIGGIAGVILGIDPINRNLPDDFVFYITATVNSDKQISNIIALLVKKEGIEFKDSQAFITKNCSISMYSYNDDKYYTLRYMGEPFDLNKDSKADDSSEIIAILSNCKLIDLNNYTDSTRKYLKKQSEKLNKLSGETFWEFPKNSKRKSTNIYFGITDIYNIGSVDKATENMYSDIER